MVIFHQLNLMIMLPMRTISVSTQSSAAISLQQCILQRAVCSSPVN